MAVALIGAGGHASVLLDVLAILQYQVRGIIDVDDRGAMRLGLPWLGGDDCFLPEDVQLVNALGGTQDTVRRRVVFEHFSKGRGYAFPILVHPSAVIAANVHLGEGCQIMAGAILQPGVRLGANCIVNTRAVIDHDCIIGDHCHLAPGSVLSGGVRLGNGCHIGTGAAVIQEVRIGSDCLVAAGAAVTRDVPSGARAKGVPARLSKAGRAR